MELDVNALQSLQESEEERGLWPCSRTCGGGYTCGETCEITRQ